MTCDRPSSRPRLRVWRGAVAAGGAVLLLFLSPALSTRVDGASAATRESVEVETIPAPGPSIASSTPLPRDVKADGRISGRAERPHRFTPVARDAYVAQFEPERKANRRFDGPRKN